MRLQDILAAAETVRATDNTPFYLSLLAIVISLVALYRASASGKNQPQVPVAHSTPPEAAAPQALPVVTSPPAASPPPSPVSETQSIPIEIVAVISAAVAATIGNNHRIVSIKPMSSSWERAGRQSVLTSHRIR
jgi:hypothetical protein